MSVREGGKVLCVILTQLWLYVVPENREPLASKLLDLLDLLVQEPDLLLKRRPPLYAILLLLLHVLTGHVSRII